MAEDRCPDCGNVLTGDRPRFCDQCGCGLTQATPPEISSVCGEKVEPTDTVPVSGSEQLGALQEQPGISASQAEEVSKKAVEPLRPVQKDDSDQQPQVGTSRGLALSINTNQFYMQGFRGVIDIKLENLSENPFDSVEAELSSNLLGHSERLGCRLEPCQYVRRRFPVKPSDAGIECVQFRIIARQAGKIYAYWADTDLLVFEHTQDLRNISIQANKLVDFGSVSDDAKYMGNAVQNHIENLLKFDKIRTANDLMVEYRKLLEDFRMLRLTFEPERPETADKGKRIVPPDRGSLTDAASLQVRSKDMPVNVVLVAKSAVTFGKNRRNDIVTRIYPRSPVNDNQSNQIGRNHCRLELTVNGVFVKDNGSVNGTLLDDKPVDADGRKIEANSKELELGGVLKMSIKCLGEKRGLDAAAYEDLLDEPFGATWNLAARAGINSITLGRLNNLDKDDKNGFESYCLVYRLATLGSDVHCSISFADKGLEPVHAAILYFGRRFYLENVSDLTDVVVNDITLSKDELIPLNFGDRIRIARLDAKFQQRSQLSIDV